MAAPSPDWITIIFGNTIDVPPGMRVENIVINGIPLEGLYRFIVESFNSPNASDAYTLRVFYNGHLQVINGNVGVHQSSKAVFVQVPASALATGTRPSRLRQILWRTI